MCGRRFASWPWCWWSEQAKPWALWRKRWWWDSHPLVRMVPIDPVEVADTTLVYDQELKVPLYARYGIPEASVLDLEHSRMHVYIAPSERGHLESRVLAKPGLIAPSALPQSAVDLAGLV